MRVAVIGAGPAGLFAAARLKERNPALSVDVFERNRADDSFGFGVVFSERTLGRLADADVRLGRELRDNAAHWDRIELRRGVLRSTCGGLGFSAIARRRLLDLLQARARESGAELHFETAVDADELRPSHDLVIAADGLNSQVRQRHAETMRPHVEVASAKYIWFGAAKAFASMTFLFARNDAGWFAVHAYPYDRDASTFVVECDEATWRRSGLDAFDVTQPPGPSDEASRLAMQELFAEHLDGAELLANNSRWASFRTVRAGAWVDGDVAIVGDAAHTAHFSVGSGTTMALEDALVLADEVADVDPAGLPAALARFEAVRRPSVERIQGAAGPSLAWWEHFAAYTQLPASQFAMHFLTRSGRVSAARLARADAGFAADVLDWLGVEDLPGVVRSSFELAGLRLRGRVVLEGAATGEQPAEVGALLSADGDDAVLTVLDAGGAATATLPVVRAAVADGAASGRDARSVLLLTAPAQPGEVPAAIAALELLDAPLAIVERAAPTDEATLAQQLTCELIRIQLGVPTALALEHVDGEWAATYVLAGRADLVVGRTFAPFAGDEPQEPAVPGGTRSAS